MSQSENIKLKERKVGEYKVPDSVYNANWRDDVESEIKMEEKNIKDKFEYYADEKDYNSMRNKKTDRVKRFRMVRKMRMQALQKAIDAAMR